MVASDEKKQTHKRISKYYRTITSITYELLTKRKVKIAEYLANFFFACLWTEPKSRSINMQKNKTKKKQKKKQERGQNPAILTEQAWSIKELLYGNTLFSRDTARNPERAR